MIKSSLFTPILTQNFSKFYKTPFTFDLDPDGQQSGDDEDSPAAVPGLLHVRVHDGESEGAIIIIAIIIIAIIIIILIILDRILALLPLYKHLSETLWVTSLKYLSFPSKLPSVGV